MPTLRWRPRQSRQQFQGRSACADGRPAAEISCNRCSMASICPGVPSTARLRLSSIAVRPGLSENRAGDTRHARGWGIPSPTPYLARRKASALLFGKMVCRSEVMPFSVKARAFERHAGSLAERLYYAASGGVAPPFSPSISRLSFSMLYRKRILSWCSFIPRCFAIFFQE